MFCSKCGASNESAANYCVKCGHAMTSGSAASQSPAATPASPPSQQPPPARPSNPNPKRKGLWNPSAAGLWSLLFTPAFGAWLQALNWRTLGAVGLEKRAMRWVWATFALFAVAVLATALLGVDARVMVLPWSLPWLLLWYFMQGKKQQDFVKQRWGKNYPHHPWGKVLLMAAGGLLAALLIALIASSLAGMGGGGSSVRIGKKGLDRPLNLDDRRAFGASCAEAFAEIKANNPREFEGLKNAGYGTMLDISQPRDQIMAANIWPRACEGLAETISKAALQDNLRLNTIRSAYAWSEQKNIDDRADYYERKIHEFREQTGSCRPQQSQAVYEKLCIETLRNAYERLTKSQQAYQSLTGKTYGPQDMPVPQ